MPRSPAKPTKPDRIGPAQWIAAALDLLAEKGIDAVRIEPLAARLGVTKGSFYWHFRDRAALHAAILESWSATSTADVIAVLEAKGGTGAERLRRLFAVTVHDRRRPQLTTAIRAWAHTDPLAARTIEQADAERIAYVTGLLEAHGLKPQLAATRARLLYLALMGSFALSGARGEDAALWDEAVRQALA
jgi:AcrR family transcriptional regulator